jgi:hypothetical protein
MIMRAPLLALLALTLTLTACAQVRESRFNPLNWFGRSEGRAIREANAQAPHTDTRPLVDQVTAMAIEPIPGGAILRATGLPPTQGHWDAELVKVDQVIETTAADGTVTRVIDDTVLVFDFHLVPPPYNARQGTDWSREIEVATYLTTNDLNGVTRVVVRGARSERISRR